MRNHMKRSMWRILAALTLVVVSAGAARADTAPEPSGRLGGVKLSRAEAGAGLALVRWAIVTTEQDKSIKPAATRDAMIRALAKKMAEKWPLAEAAPNILNEKHRMEIFVTLYGPGGGDLTAQGRGTTLAGALIDAAVNLVSNSRYRTEGWQHPEQIRIALDLTVYRAPYLQNVAEPFLFTMRPGLDGLVYENGAAAGTVLPWEAVRRPWDMHFTKQADNNSTDETRPARDPEELKVALFKSLLDRAGADQKNWKSPAAEVLRFEVQSFVEGRTGGGGDTFEIFRTGPLVRPDSVDAELLATAAARAADFLARAPDTADGMVRASYDPLRRLWGREPIDPGRQGLAAQAFLQRYGVRLPKERAKREEWLLKAGSALTLALIKDLKPVDKVQGWDQERRDCSFPVAEHKSEVSWTAQALAAVADLQAVQPDDTKRQVLARLTNTLLSAQKKDGSFNTLFAPGTDKRLIEKDSEDLTGESVALFGLVRAYETTLTTGTGDENLLKYVRRSADYLVFQREKTLGRKEIRGLADTYLIEALAALDRRLDNDAYVEYVAKCVQAVASTQIIDPSRYPLDELGGFTGPDAESASFSLRGLAAATALAKRIESSAPDRFKKLGLQDLLDTAARTRQRAEGYLLGLQYTESNSFYLPEPAVASGSFRFSACDSRASTLATANFLLAEGQ